MSPISDPEIEIKTIGLNVLTDIVEILTSSSEIPNLLFSLLEKTVKIIDPADAGMVLLWDSSSEHLHAHAVCGYDLENFKGIDFQMGKSLPGSVFESGIACMLTNSDEVFEAIPSIQPDTCQIWMEAIDGDQLPISILGLPITSGEQRHGVLVLESHDKLQVFNRQDLELAQMVADLIGLGIERVRNNSTQIAHHPVHLVEGRQPEWSEILSHQLNMPLTAIKGYASALLIDEIEWSHPKRIEFLQLIEQECQQMESLLADLLNPANIEDNRFSLELQMCSLLEAALQIAGEMEHRTDRHRLIVDFPPAFPELKADPHWIKQVLRNLLDNAIKYSPEGGLIVIQGQVRQSDVVISISDQGIGISPEELIPLFDKYVRAQSPDASRSSGTGLGLPISRMIIEAHGGHIWAQSEVGQGTTLSFSLPYK